MRNKATKVLAISGLLAGLVVALLPGASFATSARAKTVPQAKTVSVSTFNTSFTTMKYLKSVVAAGTGKIAAILPDEVSSTRYVEFDAPYLKKAFETAGLKSSQFIIQNALGSDSTQLTDAQADIAKGAKVLLVDPLDPTTGASIEKYAKARGVPVVDYDRLTLGGERTYYVSFNNVTVGDMLGNGLLSCLSAWKITKPDVAIMYGASTDNNATLFAQGYDAVLGKAGYTTTSGSKVQSGAHESVSIEPGTWTPATAETEFQQAFSATPGINALLSPNDENAAPIISYLQSQGVKPDSFPVTGQDATLTGFQNIISGFQCGTVYKPVWEEAQAAAALGIYLRAGVKPPKGLVNANSIDTLAKTAALKNVPSVLLTPEWVTPTLIKSTVIKDGVITASQLCTAKVPVGVSGAPSYSADCTKYGI
jgi:D-xylose transport system substrate-binding protein